MAGDSRLTIPWPTIALAVGAMVIALVVVPGALESRLRPSSSEAPAVSSLGLSSGEVTLAVEDLITGLNVIARTTDQHGVVQLTLRVDPGRTAQSLAADLRGTLSDLGIESYARDLDGLDAELRVYAGHLTHQLRLLPTIPAPPPIQHRPALAAIVVRGVEEPDQITALKDWPVTIVVPAYAPHSLLVADAAAMAGLEVVVELAEGEVRDQLAAVPFASGVLVPQTIEAPHLTDPFLVTLSTQEQNRRWMAPQWAAPVRSHEEAMARTQWLLGSNGAATVVVELADAQGTIKALRKRHIRLVLVSEVVREGEVRGEG